METTSQYSEWYIDFYEDYAHYANHYGCYWGNAAYELYVVTLVIASVGLPLILMATFAVYSLVRQDHVAPIYVINLLMTDLVQVCCMIVLVQDFRDHLVCLAFMYIHHFGVMVSVFFMVVVSLERYLAVVCPVWYRRRRNIRTSVVVCVVVWLFPFFYLPIFFFVHHMTIEIIIGVFLLLPFPPLIFFLVGTVKALSTENGTPSDEKRRLVSIQVLVLLIYVLLFLPRVVFSLVHQYQHDRTFEILTVIPIHFSPLADVFIYVFMKKGIVDKLLSSLCSCRTAKDDVSMSTVNHEDATAVESGHEERKEVESTDAEV